MLCGVARVVRYCGEKGVKPVGDVRAGVRVSEPLNAKCGVVLGSENDFLSEAHTHTPVKGVSWSLPGDEKLFPAILSQR